MTTGDSSPHGGVAPVRMASRVLLVHRPTSRLLLQLHGWPHETHWACPGGGLEAGETAREAAGREITEETGRHDLPGDEVFTWVHDFRFAGEPVSQHETYFLTTAEDDDVPVREPDVADGIVRRMWVSLEELDALAEPVWPPDLAVRLISLLDRA